MRSHHLGKEILKTEKHIPYFTIIMEPIIGLCFITLFISSIIETFKEGNLEFIFIGFIIFPLSAFLLMGTTWIIDKSNKIILYEKGLEVFEDFKNDTNQNDVIRLEYREIDQIVFHMNSIIIVPKAGRRYPTIMNNWDAIGKPHFKWDFGITDSKNKRAVREILEKKIEEYQVERYSIKFNILLNGKKFKIEK